jgi:hypothetical protein
MKPAQRFRLAFRDHSHDRQTEQFAPNSRDLNHMPDSNTVTEAAPELTLLKELLTRRVYNHMIGFTVDPKDESNVLVSLKENVGEDMVLLSFPGEQLKAAFQAFFEYGQVSINDVDGSSLKFDLITAGDSGKVMVTLFREGNPEVLLRGMSVNEMLKAYAIAEGVCSGNFLAVPKKDDKDGKNKSKKH